eukprot:9739525-Ditylum_brightwellii.AAC.1
MPKKLAKKSSRRGMTYTPAKKHFWCLMLGLFYLYLSLDGGECMSCKLLCMARQIGLWSPCGSALPTYTASGLHLAIFQL